MATEFVVILPPRWAHKVEMVADALEMLDPIEAALTIYRNDSEAARVNLHAANRAVRVSKSTYALLERSVLWSKRTGGAFDVTAGPLIESWGFTKRRGRKPSGDQIEQARELVGYQKLELDENETSVRFRCSGMSINFGAIGKGDALDQLAKRLRDCGICDFLIHGGNSSMIATGDPVPERQLGWPIGISHPTKPKHRLGGLWLHDGALATSGSGKQFFHHRGRRFGHVIDPRSGYPAGDLLSLTVLMESAADADACATGLFVLGSTGMVDFESEPWFPAWVAVKQGERQDEIVVESGGDVRWTAESEAPT